MDICKENPEYNKQLLKSILLWNTLLRMEGINIVTDVPLFIILIFIVIIL